MPTYRIALWQNERELGSMRWSGNFASAKAHAQTHLRAHAHTRGANRVLVQDDTGKVVFSYPAAAPA